MNRDLSYLIDREATYSPNEAICARLGEITMLPVIAPAATGKSTLINATISQDNQFSRVTSSTDRPIRPGEDPQQYRFHASGDITTRGLALEVADGEVVQYAVHPTTRNLYWSNLDGYQTPYVMLDTLSSAIPAVERLPFKEIKPIGVACDEAAFCKRFEERLANPDDARKRVAEGIGSLTWLLDQGDRVAWVDNTSPHIHNTARMVIGMVRGRLKPNPAARRLGANMLKTLQSFDI